MSSVQQNELQMLNEYIAALERQIKSNQAERQNLLQQIAKTQQNNSKADIQLRQVKNQLKQLNAVLARQGVEKSNVQNRVKIISDENEKLRREGEQKEQRIAQLNNTIKQKNELLAKQKNTVLLTTNYHSKQVGSMQDKVRELQQRLNQEIQQRNLLNYSLNSCNQQLATQKQQNDKLRSKNGFCETYIETLQGKVRLFQKELHQTYDQKDLVTRSLQRTSEQLVKNKQEIEKLSIQLIHGNQSSEQSRKSYENFINGLKSKYELQIAQLKDEVQQHKTQIQQKKQSIEHINVLLSQQRANYQKEFQKTTQLSEQLSQLQKQHERVKRQTSEQIRGKDTIIHSLEKQGEQLMTKWRQTQNQLERTITLKYRSEEQLNLRQHETEIRYDQDIREKEEHIDALNSKLTAKAIEIQQLRYDLSETRKRQNLLSEELRKREDQVDTLNINLEMKKQKIEELSHQLSETYRNLHDRTKDYQEKGRQGEVLTQKQSQLAVLVENLKKEIHLLTKLKQQKNMENKRLKTKIESISQELSEAKKTEARINKQVQDNQEKLSKTLQDFTNTKEGSDKRLAETLRKVNELQRELEKLKKNYKEKQDLLKMLTTDYELKNKEFLGKEQEMGKRLIEIESKHGRQIIKLAELEKELEKKDHDFNKAIEKLISQHTNENHELSKRHQNQIRELQAKYFEQITNLNKEFQAKSLIVKELENQLSKYQMTSVQYSSNQSSMEKTIMLLQRELDQSHKQINAYHEKIFAFNNATDSTKEQIIQRDIKIISFTALLEKARKDNERLLNQEILLREQVAALQSSTTYLKKQLTSTLDRQQTSLKEIRTLQEANKSYSKLMSSASSNNINAINERLSSSRNVERQKSVVSIGGDMRRSALKNEFVTDSIVEEDVENVAHMKWDNKVVHKYSKPQSSTSIDSPKKGTEAKSVTFGKDSFDISEFVNTNSANHSRNSAANN